MPGTQKALKKPSFDNFASSLVVPLLHSKRAITKVAAPRCHENDILSIYSTFSTAQALPSAVGAILPSQSLQLNGYLRAHTSMKAQTDMFRFYK